MMTSIRPSLTFLLLLVFVIPVTLPAQTDTAPIPTYYVGAGAGWQFNYHTTMQNVSPDGSDCGQFTYGKAPRWYYGLIGEYQPFPWLRGLVRLTYSRMDGVFQTICNDGIIVPTGNDNEFVPLTREHTKHVTLDYGLLELGVKVFPLDLPVFVSAGVNVGVPLFLSKYSQSERIVSPQGVVFPGNVIARSTGAGDLQTTQTRSAVFGGLGYTFSLHGYVELTPEIAYVFPFSDVTTEGEWKVENLRAGVTLTWGFGVPEPPPHPPEPVREAPPPPPAPVARIGTTTDASVHILETYVTETFPLLPYVFFDHGSDVLKPSYVQRSASEIERFREKDLPRKTLDMYYNILDIVGVRMKQSKDITITLIGSTDDKDIEFANTGLALARAVQIEEYLQKMWGIDSARIAITTQKLPPIPTSQIYVEGDEENRRVDITSASDDLFRPVVHERFSEYSITPPRMELNLGAESSDGIVSWQVEVKRKDTVVMQFHGEGAPPLNVHWTLDEALARDVGVSDTLSASLRVTDTRGTESVSAVEIPVYKSQNAYEIGRLSLIVFDFDKSTISAGNRRMIRHFVAEAIKPTSSVVITGSTDRLGEDAHNEELSKARAESVKEILLSQNPVVNHLEARGIGEAPQLFDNDLPEGRFYCRTVAVEVKTPMN